MADQDEVVEVVHEVPSKLVAEADLRHEQAKGDDATPQEKKQAAVEMASATANRPQGSFAQLHETEEATLAVVDDDHRNALVDEEKRKAEADAKEAAEMAEADEKAAKQAASK